MATSQNGGNGSGGDGGQQNQNNGGDGGGSQNQNIPDLSTLQGPELEKVLENKALWDHPRIKKLVSSNQQLEKLQNELKAKEEKELEANEEHKKLADKRKEDLEGANKTIQNMKIDQALTGKLVPEGVVDLEAALKLVDRSLVKIDDDGQITGLDKAIKSLKDTKGYLFKTGDGTSLGSASNNGEGGKQTTKFKRSQLKDPEFYKKNRDAILAAQKAGQIEDDLS